jgi:iron complex outermembrane receptor protein
MINRRHASVLKASTVLSSLLLGAAFAPAAVQAQTPSQTQLAQTAIQEIVVTARKREETVLTTPISITAFSGEVLQKANIKDIRSLTQLTPGVTFDNIGQISNATITIRGLAQPGLIADETNVGIFVDGIYASGRTGTDFFINGIERVEVVRGPQSALYGRNTFSGAINYITRQPGNEYEGGANVEIGSDDRKGVAAYAAGPILKDLLFLRVDAARNESGSTIKNDANGERLGNRKSDSLRAALRATPTDDLQIRLSATYFDDDISAQPQFYLPTALNTVGRTSATAAPALYKGKVPNLPVVGGFFSDPRAYGVHREIWRFNGIIDYAINDNWKIESLTGYNQINLEAQTDLDDAEGTPFTFTVPFPPPPRPQIFIGQTLGAQPQEDRGEFEQELRLEGGIGDRLNVALGGFFYKLNLEQRLTTGVEGLPAFLLAAAPATVRRTLPPINADGSSPATVINKFTTETWSIFGSADYKLTDAMKVTAEARYTWEDKTVNNIKNDQTPASIITGFQSASFNYFTPRVIVDYRLPDGYLLYASVARGLKTGGFNPGAPIASEKTFDPESNWTYEVGAKGAFLENSLFLTLSAYYIDWSKQQVRGFSTVRPAVGQPVVIVTNVGTSESKGLEFEATWRANEYLTILGGYAFSDATFKKALDQSVSGYIDLDVGPTGDVSGKRLPRTSKHSFNVSGILTVPISDNGWNAFARTDFSYKSKQYFDSANLAYAGPRVNMNASIGVENDNLRVSLWAENLTNNKTIDSFYRNFQANGVQRNRVQSRQGRFFGASANYKF